MSPKGNGAAVPAKETRSAAEVHDKCSTRGVAVAPVVVSDRTSLAVAGLDGRQLRQLVAEKHVPHVAIHRHIYVRLDALLGAMGLAETAPARSSVELNEDEIVARAAR